MKRTNLQAALILILSTFYINGCDRKNAELEALKNQAQTLNTQIEKLSAELKTNLEKSESIEKNLKNFDTLDFTVFSQQKWEGLSESHSKDIKVYWPDGHMTQGFDVHLQDLKAMFVYAPDTKIAQHPIRIGSGKYTAVTGVMEGTFTKPMPIGNGKFVQPTGKRFKLPMATFGVWENGVMVEEHLFWDNLAFMKQIGVMK